MGLIEYYLIFAITTSIFALIDVYVPTLKEAISKDVKNSLTANPKTSYVIYFIITAIIAPLVILPMLVPSMNERFRNSLSKIIHEQE